MSKIIDLVNVLRKGAVVADPVVWKNRQNLVNALGGFMVAGYAFAQGAGWIHVNISTSDILAVATGVAAVFGVVFNIGATVATTTKIGLPGLDPAPSELREPAGPPAAAQLPGNNKLNTSSGTADNGNPFL